MRIGKCNDCGTRGTIYAWQGSCPLSLAVCPVHGTPLARTTQGKRTLIELGFRPDRQRSPKMAEARRFGAVLWRTLDNVLAEEMARGS